MSDQITYEVSTTPSPDGAIRQTVYLSGPGMNARQRIIDQVLRTCEEGIRDALIQLGWTPPPEQRPGNRPPRYTYKTLGMLGQMYDERGEEVSFPAARGDGEHFYRAADIDPACPLRVP